MEMDCKWRGCWPAASSIGWNPTPAEDGKTRCAGWVAIVIPKRASSNETMQGFEGARGILVLIGTRFRGGQDSSCAIECDVRLGRGGAFGMTVLYGVIPSDKPADASTP
jgi:hypothetical protein